MALPFTRDLPTPGIELRSPALQADSLPAESQEHYYDKWLLLLLLFWCSILSTPSHLFFLKEAEWVDEEDEKGQDRRWKNRSYPLPCCLEPGAPPAAAEGRAFELDVILNFWFTLEFMVHKPKAHGEMSPSQLSFITTDSFDTWKWAWNYVTLIMNGSNPKAMKFAWGIKWWGRENVGVGRE